MKLSRIKRADWVLMGLVGLIILLQFFWLPGPPDTPNDSFSSARPGYLALYRTLDALLPRVERNTDSLLPSNDYSVLLMLGPNRYPTPREEERLDEFVRSGGALLIAPNWNELEHSFDELGFKFSHRSKRTEDELESGDDEKESANENQKSRNRKKGQQDNEESEELEVDEDFDWGLGEFPVINIESPLLTDGQRTSVRAGVKLDVPRFLNKTTLAVSGSGQVEVASWERGAGLIIACSSPDFFNNVSLTRTTQGELAVRIVEHAVTFLRDEYYYGEQPVVYFDEYLNSSSQLRYTNVMFSPQLRSGTLQMLLLAIMIVWFGFHRFGPSNRFENRDRKTMTDNAIAVGNLQFRASQGGHVVERYLDYMQNHLRRMFGGFVNLDDSQKLASRSGLDEKEIAEKLARAKMMAKNSNVNPAEVAEMVRWLAHLHNCLGRTRNSKR